MTEIEDQEQLIELYNKKVDEYYKCSCVDVDPDLSINLEFDIDSMNETDVVNTVLKLVGVNCFKKYLYQYQLGQIKKYYENDKPTNKMSLTDFSVKAINLFNSYQWRAGGFNLEDKEWLMYDATTGGNYDVDNNEIIFVNTVPIYLGMDKELDKYTDLLVQHLNKFAANISVECRVRKERKDKVMFVMLLCQDNDIPKHTVSL